MDSLSALADFDCTKTKFEYDIAGRLVKRIWPDGAPVTYSYNDRGLLSQKLEGNRTTVYSYDTMNRLTKILIEDASASKGRARLAETASNGGSSSTSTAGIDRQSSTTLLSYSSTDKFISIADESGKIEFAYDSFGLSRRLQQSSLSHRSNNFPAPPSNVQRGCICYDREGSKLT